MKIELLDILICPDCLPAEHALTLGAGAREQDGDILEGALCCAACGREYPIAESVATLLPGGIDGLYNSKYEQPSVIDTYLGSHFGDLAPSHEQADSPYQQWATTFVGRDGLFLDAGCGVGRMVFERSAHHARSIGVDLSRAFVDTARRIAKTGQVTYEARIEGELFRREDLRLPDHWRCDRVEFLVADVTALPFRSCFAGVSSLNILDKVPAPLDHLVELNRVALDRAAELLVTDPFSWSEEVAPRSAWLGGTDQGPYAGRGLDNVRRLLSDGTLSPPWQLGESRGLRWRLRNHANHAEDIRSQGFHATR